MLLIYCDDNVALVSFIIIIVTPICYWNISHKVVVTRLDPSQTRPHHSMYCAPAYLAKLRLDDVHFIIRNAKTKMIPSTL